MGMLLLIVLIIFCVGTLPSWSYWGPTRPNGYGYGPSLIGLVLVILVLLWLFGGLGHLRLRGFFTSITMRYHRRVDTQRLKYLLFARAYNCKSVLP